MKNKDTPLRRSSSVFQDLDSVRRAMLEDIGRSDLSKVDALKLQLKPMEVATVQTKLKSLPAARAGYVIPYFTIQGKANGFYRFRYLEYGTEKGLAQLVAKTKKPLRYGQPASTTNHLYFPPYIDWVKYSQDPTKPLLITEGEKKAACATKHGLPTIGLGGVWCFKSANARMPMLPDFMAFKWKGRPVYIMYDSDAVTNVQVIRAENALARELLQLGAVPYVCRLPNIIRDAKKTGLDDYIAEKGSDALFKRVIERTDPWQAAQELHGLNEEVVYVVDPGLILRLDTLQRITARAFCDHAFSTRIYYEEQGTKDGGTKLIEKSAPREWLKWVPRAEVQRITYRPGEDRITNGELNTWPGWGIDEPIAGEVKRWHLLLDYLFYGSPPEERQWFEQWLAYPLQNPGVKLYTAAVLWGVHHGTGKSLIGYTMMKLYGRNATEISDRDLFSSYNEWAENRQFVMGDEITGGDKRATADRMKSMITQRLIRINPKYVPSYTVPDCINYYFTSNHPDAFFLEDTDRRFFIHEVKGKPKTSEFYQDYVRWLDGDGAAKLFYYMLNLDVRSFNPQGHAPITSSKQEMIDTGRSELAYWVSQLKMDPARTLLVAGKPCSYTLLSSDEIRLIYDPLGETKVTVNGMARELKRSGLVQAWRGMPVQTSSGVKRLWIVRDADRLVDAGSNVIRKIYEEERTNAGNVQAKKGKSKF